MRKQVTAFMVTFALAFAMLPAEAFATHLVAAGTQATETQSSGI